VTDLARMIATKEVSPVEVVRAHLARIERLDGTLHAYITVCGDAALDAARAAEAALAARDHHMIGAAHHAGLRLQRTPRRVLERLAGPQHGLFSDDSRAAHLFDVAGRVGDDPVARHELHRLAAFVRDAHGVVEEPLVVERVRVLGRVSRLDFDAHVVGHRL